MSTRSTAFIVIPDGAADEAQASLGGRTPLEAAQIPEMDRIAREGVLGRSRNVPDEFTPASDVATLSLFGYDPRLYYTGRAPLEAAAMGIALHPLDWAVRCNLMTILDGRMTDFTVPATISATKGPQVLIAAIAARLGSERIEFHPGVSYRNLMIYRGGADSNSSAPAEPGPAWLKRFQESVATRPEAASTPIAADLGGGPLRSRHPDDSPARRARPAGRRPSADWPRFGAPSNSDGGGRFDPPRSPGQPGPDRRRTPAGQRDLALGPGPGASSADLRAAPRIEGSSMILSTSGLDLVSSGVGVLAGWDRVDVPGATGYLDTDYAAKGRYGIEALKDHDLVCIHVEAPDEASHEGRAEAKVEALERIDHDIVGPLRRALENYGELADPHHARSTQRRLSTRAHDRAWVTWAMAGTKLAGSGHPYNEPAALVAGGPALAEGHRLMETFLNVGSQ